MRGPFHPRVPLSAGFAAALNQPHVPVSMTGRSSGGTTQTSTRSLQWLWLSAQDGSKSWQTAGQMCSRWQSHTHLDCTHDTDKTRVLDGPQGSSRLKAAKRVKCVCWAFSGPLACLSQRSFGKQVVVFRVWWHSLDNRLMSPEWHV